MPETVMRLASDYEKALPRKLNFTASALADASCPPGKDRVTIYDAKTPGLALRVTSAAHRSFILYRKINGRPMRMKLGSFPQITIENARKIAAEENNKIARGVDPMEDRKAIRASDTLQTVYDRFEKEYAALRYTDRTKVTNKSRFDTCFEGWKSRPVATIKTTNVQALHTELAKSRGKVTANRAVQLLRRLLNWAKVKPNPAGQGCIEFFGETERERFLDASELPRFFAAVELEPNETMRDYLKVSLFTGARRSNVCSMTWDEVNLDTAVWIIPGGKSKSGKPIIVHLSAPALATLKSRKGSKSPWVFPGGGKNGHITEPRLAWQRVLKSAGISDLRIHDLRRTLGSWMAAGGTSLHVIGKTLGHHDVQTTAIYSRLNLDPVKASVNTAVDAMLATMEPLKPAKKTSRAKGKRKK